MSPRLLSVAIALLIALTGGIAFGSGPAAATMASGTLITEARAVTPSATIRFEGALPSRIRRPIVLQRKSSFGWFTLSTSRTSRRGRITLAYPAPSLAGTYAYRVLAGSHFVGARRYAAMVTPTVRVRVLPQSSTTPTTTLVVTTGPTPTAVAPTTPVSPRARVSR